MSKAPISAANTSTIALVRRLWREHVRHFKGRIALIVAATLALSATTALYPIIIKWAFDLFADKDKRILYQVPLMVLAVTAVKGSSMYLQAVMTQDMVLLVIRRLQVSMFGHLTNAALARVEREAPAQLATRFTTDATVIRDAMTRAVNAVADATTVVGLVVSMFVIDWQLSLISAFIYPLAAMPIDRIGPVSYTHLTLPTKRIV